MVRSALKELQNRLHLRSGSWSSSPASLAARKRGSRSWRSMWMKTPGCGEWWDPATRVKELLVDCSKPTEASVSGLLEKIWGMQKPTREKDSHCPQSQQQQYCGPGAVSRTPCASGPEVSSLTLKIKVTGFSLVWPGSMPTTELEGGWSQWHRPRWREGCYPKIASSFVSRRTGEALLGRQSWQLSSPGDKSTALLCPGQRGRLSHQPSDCMLQVGLEEHRSDLGLRRVTVHAGELQVHGSSWEQFNSFLKSIYLFTWLCCVLVVVSGILSCGMRDVVPWPGIEPRPPALGAWSLTTGPPGRSWEQFNSWIPMVWCCHMALRDPDYFQYILTS